MQPFLKKVSKYSAAMLGSESEGIARSDVFLRFLNNILLRVLTTPLRGGFFLSI